MHSTYCVLFFISVMYCKFVFKIASFDGLWALGQPAEDVITFVLLWKFDGSRTQINFYLSDGSLPSPVMGTVPGLHWGPLIR
jgi:hypothetical protein